MRHDYRLNTLLLLLVSFLCFAEITKSVNIPDNQNPLVFNSESSGIEDDEEISSKPKIAILRITVFYDASQWTNKCDEATKNNEISYFQDLVSNGKTIKHFNFKDILVKRIRNNCGNPTDFRTLDMVLDISVEEDKKHRIISEYDSLKNMILSDLKPDTGEDNGDIFKPNVLNKVYHETYEKITQFEIWKYECDPSCKTCTRPPLSFIKSIVNTTKILDIENVESFEINDVRGCKPDLSES